MNALLQDRIAIITGAAGDLGFAMAMRFLEAGASVALIDISRGELQKRCDRAGLPAARTAAIEADIASPESVDAAVGDAVRRFGALHILVNNAAVASERRPAAEIPVGQWRRALDVNLTGSWLMARAAIPHLRAAGGGVILNISSQLGHVASAGGAEYSATKAALHSLTRSLAVDYAADRIRAVSLSPGAVMTSRLTKRYGDEPAVNAALAAKHPMGRIGTPEEIAETALFLVSDGASFITGSDVLADGGYTAV